MENENHFPSFFVKSVSVLHKMNLVNRVYQMCFFLPAFLSFLHLDPQHPPSRWCIKRAIKAIGIVIISKSSINFFIFNSPFLICVFMLINQH